MTLLKWSVAVVVADFRCRTGLAGVVHWVLTKNRGGERTWVLMPRGAEQQPGEASLGEAGRWRVYTLPWEQAAETVFFREAHLPKGLESCW